VEYALLADLPDYQADTEAYDRDRLMATILDTDTYRAAYTLTYPPEVSVWPAPDHDGQFLEAGEAGRSFPWTDKGGERGDIHLRETAPPIILVHEVAHLLNAPEGFATKWEGDGHTDLWRDLLRGLLVDLYGACTVPAFDLAVSDTAECHHADAPQEAAA
jgi:hypothetical protein